MTDPIETANKENGFLPLNKDQQWRIFNALLPFHGETGNEAEWTAMVCERLVSELRARRQKADARFLTYNDIGMLARRTFWKDGAFVRITAIGERKFLADLDGYESVYQNDGDWIVGEK